MRAFPIGAIALLFLLSAAPASACNCPTLMIVGPAGAAARNVAGPGDQVRYTITQLTGGARWSLVVDGSEIDSGVASGTQVAGTFVVPDLGGSSRDVNVAAQVAHADFDGDGCPTRPFDTLAYTIPAPPPSDPSELGAPQGGDQAGGDEPAPDGKRPERPQEPLLHRHEHPASTPQRAKPHGAPPTPMTDSGPADATPAPRPAAPLIGDSSTIDHPALAGRAHEPATAVTSPNGPVAAIPYRGELRSVQSLRGDPVSEPGGGGIPLGAVIALGVLVLAGIGGGGWTLVRTRLRPSPEPHGARAAAPPELPRADFDAVEAELQELIAEERARHLSREAAAIRTGPADAAE